MKGHEDELDVLLREFHLNVKMHEQAIEHAYEKGMKRNELNTFSQPEAWDILTEMIEQGNYHTQPTTVRYLCKLTGVDLSHEMAMAREMVNVREIYVMERIDRVVWNMLYQVLYKYYADWIHPACKSYKKGESTQTVAKELSKRLSKMKRYTGFKHDLSKYFDSVPIWAIDRLIAKMEKRYPSKIWKVIKEFYHDDRVVVNGKMVKRFGSLKQGCAMACLFADLLLSEIDRELTKFNVIYYRYSDDLIIIGKESGHADKRLKEMLNEYGLKLNDKKTEYLKSDTWFTFLGFRFKGSEITISKKSLKNIEHKIKTETISKAKQKRRALTDHEIRQAIDNIQYYLFIGCESHRNGMASYLFNACNVVHDLAEIDRYAKDCIRAAKTNKTEIYGLGSSYSEYGVIHGKGTNVKENKKKTKGYVKDSGWYSLVHMYEKYHQGKGAYNAEILKMQNGVCVEL